MTTHYPAPDPPWAGPAAHDSGPGNLPALRIVIHSTVSPCEPGGRWDVARYFRSEAAGGSAHYVADPVSCVQVVPDSVIAWHAPPNPHSFGIEMCDLPSKLPGRWRGENHQAMLHVVAQLTAELCLAYDIPATWLGPRQLRAGHKGITSHNNVSRTWHQSTHWDPGSWPRRRFMRMVRSYIEQERRERWTR